MENLIFAPKLDKDLEILLKNNGRGRADYIWSTVAIKEFIDSNLAVCEVNWKQYETGKNAFNNARYRLAGSRTTLKRRGVPGSDDIIIRTVNDWPNNQRIFLIHQNKVEEYLAQAGHNSISLVDKIISEF